MLALIKNNEYLSQHHEGSRLDLPSGTVIMANKAGELPDDYFLFDIIDALPIPEGKRLLSTSVEFINNAWTVVNILADIIPPTPEELRAQMPELTPRQFRDALIDADIMPDQVTAAIKLIPDAKQQAKALNAWEYPTQFTRIDPLLDQIGVMFGLTPEQIDTLWMGAASNG